jgi:hypothetical protein
MYLCTMKINKYRIKKFLFFTMLLMMFNVIALYIDNKDIILSPMGKVYIYVQLFCIGLIGGYIGAVKRTE